MECIPPPNLPLKGGGTFNHHHTVAPATYGVLFRRISNNPNKINQRFYPMLVLLALNFAV